MPYLERGHCAVDDQLFVAYLAAEGRCFPDVGQGLISVLGPKVREPNGWDESTDHTGLVAPLPGQGVHPPVELERAGGKARFVKGDHVMCLAKPKQRFELSLAVPVAHGAFEQPFIVAGRLMASV